METQQSINKRVRLSLSGLTVLCACVLGCNSTNSLGDPHTFEDYVEGKASTLGVLTDNPAETTRWGAIAGGGLGLAAGATQIISGGWALPMVSIPLAIAETWVGYSAGAVAETTIERTWDLMARRFNHDSLKEYEGQPTTLKAIAAMRDAGISDNGIYRFMRENPPAKPFDALEQQEIESLGFTPHLIAFSERQLRLHGRVTHHTVDAHSSGATPIIDQRVKASPLTKSEVYDLVVRQRIQPPLVEREILTRGVKDSLTTDEILEWSRVGIPPYVINAMEKSTVRIARQAPILDAASFK